MFHVVIYQKKRFLTCVLLYIVYLIDYKINEMNDQQEMMNNVQGWNTMPSHDIMIPVPIKIQPPLGILDQNNIQINNSSPHPSVIHTSPQTPHVSYFFNILTCNTYLNILYYF